MQSFSPYAATQVTAQQTNAAGEITFDWTAPYELYFSNSEHLRLIKVYSGGKSTAHYISVFSAQEEKILRKSNSWTVTITI